MGSDLATSVEKLRRTLPVGFLRGDEDGEVLFHPDESVITAINSVFKHFTETGSARRVAYLELTGVPTDSHIIRVTRPQSLLRRMSRVLARC
jgi:hypothetical protein